MNERFILALLLVPGLFLACHGMRSSEPVGRSHRVEATIAVADSPWFGETEGDARPSAGPARTGADRPTAARSGLLTASEWRDLDNWDEWRRLVEGPFAHTARRWGFDAREPVEVRVESQGRPVADVKVTLHDAAEREVWTARTDNKGRAYLFVARGAAAEGPFRVVAEHEGRAVGKRAIAGERIVLEVPKAPTTSQSADVMFVVDTTGSMGDELSYLQVELEDVMERVRRRTGNELDIRLSVNFYRDRGDAYVVRSHDFTREISSAVQALRDESAAGGGDFPEAVDLALQSGIRDHDWSSQARARLLFLVLDAPPHDNQQVVARLHALVRDASRRGIRIIPVTASGIDKSTEFLMRNLSVKTGGTYVFLTDDSGVGGGHLEASVGATQVEKLNDLLTRLIIDATQPSLEQPLLFSAR